MARFVIDLDAPIEPEEAWRRVFDLRQHSRIIPLTTVFGEDLDSTSLHVGSRFVGRTGLGALSFDDPMTIDVWSPPDPDRGHCAIAKHGLLIRGRIDVTIERRPSGSVVRWEQHVTTPIPCAARLAKPAIRVGYRWALRKLLDSWTHGPGAATRAHASRSA